MIPDLDISAIGNQLPWEVTDVPAGRWELYTFLDVDHSGCDNGFNDGDLWLESDDSCLDVEVTAGQDIIDLEIVFTYQCGT